MGMKKTGIFGGTFAPVHNGHVRLAIESLEQLELDRVIFIPNFEPPHKKMPLIGTADRLKMLRLALECFECFEVSEIEINRACVSYTIDTVKQLKKEYPGSDLYFMIGEDSYRDFHTWYRYEELVREIKFVVYPRLKSYNDLRQGFDDKKGAFLLLDAPVIDISSSLIRDKLVSGKSISLLVDAKVEEYLNNEYNCK